MEHAGFPSEETLAAYIDGRLDEKTRRRVVAHLAECDECYAIVVATAEFHAEEGIARVARSSRGHWLWIGAAAAALIALAVVILTPVRQWIHPTGTRLLARSAGPHRHIEPRLAGFPYQSLQATRGPSDLTKDPDNWRLTAAAASVQKDAARRRTPETLHALGVYYLLYGHFDDAVSTLEEALTTATGDPTLPGAVAKSTDVRLLTDLAAACEARAQNGRDRLLAYEVMNRAWKLEPQSPEVLWNRALAIEGLSLKEDAAAAWQAYLRVDASSRWADEAREHLRRLRTRGTSERWKQDRRQLEAAALAGRQDRVNAVVARFPFRARTWSEDELLPEWGRTRSTETLTVVRAIGTALGQTSGERMLADSVAAIDASRGPAREALARGHAAYGAAQRLFDEQDIVHAKPQLELAAKSLDQGGSALAAFARLQLAACAYMENRYDAAVSELLAVQQLEASRRHFALRGRADWLRGLVEDQLGHPYEAIALYQSSFDAFAHIHEGDNEAAMDALLADTFDRVGDSDEAMNHAGRAVDVVSVTGTRFRFHRILLTAAQVALDQGYTAAAELFLNRLHASEATTAKATENAETLVMLGMAYQSDGDRTRAASAIRRGEEYCQAVADPHQRKRLTSYALAALAGSGAIPRTSFALTNAITFVHTNGSRAALAQLYAERGEVWREEKRPDLAERDFERSLEEREAEGGRPPVSPVAVQQPFDSMLRLLIDEHRYGAALLVADRSDRLQVAGPPTRLESVVSLQRMLPPNAVVVAYHVMSDRLLTWTVTGTGAQFYELRVPEDRIRSAIAALAGAAVTARDPETLRPAGMAAGRLLLGSWLASIPPNATIIFVPDSVVDDAPFAALVNPATKRFLIEEHPLATSGSMAAFIRCMAADRSRRDSSDAVFASPPPPAGMERLPYSEREIENASLIWRRHKLLEGADATKAAFLDCARSAAVIHFAGHAKISDRAPMTSALVFPDSLLYLSELSQKAFDHARLFVLAACSTGRQPRPGISLAAALTAQSVPSVVASLWDADDRSSAVLFTRFHQELRRGAGRATALQHAQLSLLFAADPDLRKPASWAGFQMIGAVGPIEQERNDV